MEAIYLDHELRKLSVVLVSRVIFFPPSYKNLCFHRLVRSYEPGTLHLSSHTNAQHLFGFLLQVFRQAGPSKRVDFLALMGNKRLNVFSKDTMTHYQLGNRTRCQQPFGHQPGALPLSYRRRFSTPEL